MDVVARESTVAHLYSIMKQLETSRLLLRPFTAGDFDETYRLLYADEAVAKWWTGYKEFEKIKTAFDEKVKQAEDDFGFMAVVRMVDAQLVGTVAIQPYRPDEDNSWLKLADNPDYRVGANPDVVEAELTYAMGRDYWRNGYAQEASRVLIRHGFEVLNVRRFVNAVHTGNEASIGLMCSLGFRLVRAASSDGIVGILEKT